DDAVGSLAFFPGTLVNRMRRANGRIWRHGGNVRGERNVSARTARHRTFRGDINDGRNRRRVEFRDDVVHGRDQAAWRVQLDDEALIIPGCRNVERAGDVSGGGGGGGTVDFDKPNLRGLERRGTKNQRDGNPTLHNLALTKMGQ